MARRNMSGFVPGMFLSKKKWTNIKGYAVRRFKDTSTATFVYVLGSWTFEYLLCTFL